MVGTRRGRKTEEPSADLTFQAPTRISDYEGTSSAGPRAGLQGAEALDGV